MIEIEGDEPAQLITMQPVSHMLAYNRCNWTANVPSQTLLRQRLAGYYLL